MGLAFPLSTFWRSFVVLIARSSLSSSVCIGSGFAEDFLDLALDRSGMEGLDVVAVLDFFDNLVDRELAGVD